MTIAKRTPIFHCLLLAGALSLAACGGGGGGGKKQPPVDTTPNAITLAAAANAEPNAVVTSAPVTITGINTSAPVSITGGEYSISGGAFTANPGTVTNGQTITVRITSSDKTNTPKEAVLTVGGVSAKFVVTTLADVTPDAFTFTPVTNASLNSEQTSTPITVKGIDIAVPVSITGGLYAINGGAFTSAPGTVSADQTITVKTTAAAKTETTQEAVLTIGGVSGTFSVITILDTFPPIAEFKFPTPYTMSEAASVKVRGTATDDNAITNVKVVVRSYKLEAPNVTLSTKEIDATPKAEANGVKDFSSWTVDVPLTALAENEIKVVATDARNNSIAVDAANKVVIRQANVASAFPDEVNEFKYIFAGLAIDRHSEKNRLLISELRDRKIIEVDFATGQRTVFSDKPTGNNQPLALAIDPISKRLFASSSGLLYEINIQDGSIVNNFDTSSLTEYFDVAIETVNGQTNLVFVENVYLAPGKLAKFSVDNNQLTVISDQAKVPGLEDVFGLDVDLLNNRYLVASGGQADDLDKRAVIAVDRISGAHSVLSSNSIGSGPLFSGVQPGGYNAALIDVEVDQKRNRALISEFPSKLFSVDLTTGNRSLFKDLTYKNVDSDADKSFELYNMKIDVQNDLLFGIDSKRKSIFEIDLETEERVIISKSRND